MLLFLFVILSWPSQQSPVLSEEIAPNELLVRINIHSLTDAELVRLKASDSISWWVENGDELLLLAKPELRTQIDDLGYEILSWSQNPKRLAFLKWDPHNTTRSVPHRVLSKCGPLWVLELLQPYQETKADSHMPRIWPFKPNTVLVRKNRTPAQTCKAGPAPFQPLVDLVDPVRWFSDVETLASYNRYTHNPEVLDARDWIVSQFQSMPGLTVTSPSFAVGGTTAYNVVAFLPGLTRPQDWYIVGAHYDSTSEIPNTLAPGAEDNASGAAGVLEMARIFSAYPTDASIVFICFGGEEQGLNGSEHHVSELIANGELDQVQAVINMDMIGYTGDTELDCLLETESFAADLSQSLEQAALQYSDLVIYTTFNAWGSDHVPYLNASKPAVLTIENDWNSYPHYHQSTDLPAHVDLQMGSEILKMNVATLADLATSQADLVIDDWTLLNPGDNGAADPGETLDIEVTLTNSGLKTASSIQSTLSSSDPRITVLQSDSTFLNIAPGLFNTAITPFQVMLSSDIVCGETLSLQLDVDFDDGSQKSVSLQFSLPTGVPLGIDHGIEPNLPIPDNDPTGISSPITVDSTPFTVTSDLQIHVDISHSYRGDLSVDLESPSQTIVRLWNQTGGTANDLVGTFPTTLSPAESLDVLLGEPLQGTWVLHIIDHASGDSGTLNSWRISNSNGYDCDSPGCQLSSSLVPNAGTSIVECLGQTLDLSCQTSGGSGPVTYQWAVQNGLAQFVGPTDGSSVTVKPLGYCVIQCLVSQDGCQDVSSLNLDVTHNSFDGDNAITLVDLQLLITAFWTSGTFDPDFDFNSDQRIDMLDFIDYVQCL